MLCLDKLKIVTSIDYIKNIDLSKFQVNIKNDVLQYHKYQQKQPCSLLIMVNYEHNELVIEFTGKVLGDNYKSLINKNTIQECFTNINNLTICKLDIDMILNDSEVCKCDVTKDVVCPNIKGLKQHIKTNLANYSKWVCKPYKNGFILENIVGTPRFKNRVTVYNKSKELKMANNLPFLNSLSNKEDVLSYFNDKIRIEHNINTKSQIKQFLNIPNNQLVNVLNSDANPILTVFNKALKEIPINNTCAILSLKERLYELMLEKCDFDLSKVEAEIRYFSSKNSSITKAMKPYKELYHRLQKNTISAIDIRNLVA